ncbi:hypothetical protein C496_05060 [Natronorubrum tibetense GA33]|uniref:Uncharacterized protein n=1 Tax=Natronorubrum tibetense GA33 TaxID=1114856 RepID=L9W2W1_9EURY|nr:hypothetical protein C496_05060 [Natronorubrum tibetense GA33]
MLIDEFTVLLEQDHDVLSVDDSVDDTDVLIHVASIVGCRRLGQWISSSGAVAPCTGDCRRCKRDGT